MPYSDNTAGAPIIWNTQPSTQPPFYPGVLFPSNAEDIVKYMQSTITPPPNGEICPVTIEK